MYSSSPSREWREFVGYYSQSEQFPPIMSRFPTHNCPK